MKKKRPHYHLGTVEVRVTRGHDGPRVHLVADNHKTTELLRLLDNHSRAQGVYFAAVGIAIVAIVSALILHGCGVAPHFNLGVILTGLVAFYGYQEHKFGQERRHLEKLLRDYPQT